MRQEPSRLGKKLRRDHVLGFLTAEPACTVAAQRPTTRFVAVKNEEQQTAAIVLRLRDVVVHQRTRP